MIKFTYKDAEYELDEKKITVKDVIKSRTDPLHMMECYVGAITPDIDMPFTEFTSFLKYLTAEVKKKLKK